ncbi:serpin family protein [Oceanirhabdus sp. W0125-5]|uniref:serpin family protein n=1 Tax=Oceanirhabdus sp. W0125-5 TaxID=2999116 RepID=UPI0022F2C9C7|nr:serpin family protein [Oceanirhabdus sp. W0125-5]WBW98247.1 serpin family protein [Oceanirhabdus sp. W0125-5]
MKKRVCIFLLILMIVGLSGCNKPVKNIKSNIEVETIKVSVKDKNNNQVDVADVSKAVNRATFSMMKELNKEKNMLISPLSIVSSLALLQNGGSNGSDDEIIRFLFGKDLELNQAKELINTQFRDLIINCVNDEKDEVIIGNSVWFDNRVSDNVNDDFLKVSKENFFSEVYTEDFINNTKEAVGKVNKWIELKSKGKLKDIMEEEEVSDEFWGTSVNTLYFKGNWSTEFNPSMTKKEKFTKANGDSIMVDMMNKITYSSVYEDDNMYALHLPYQGAHTMTFILPKNGITLNEVLKDMSLNHWNKIKNDENRMYSEVKLKVPKFRYEYETKLREYLSDNGINKIFTSVEKPLEGIMNNAYISEIVHNTVISLDEEGTEAAAVTRELLCGSGMPENEVEFYCDKPFAFIISNWRNNTILFSGVVYEPKF